MGYKQNTELKTRSGERGNVLFLILIAVALFAALSYAVTQSTRSGSGTADKEKSMLSSASMTQYPTALRTSVIRMVLAGTDISQIVFDTPASFTTMSDVTLDLFHPTGGGAVYQQAPAEIMSTASLGTWFFNANWDIPEIGIDDSSAGNDLIAFLPNVNFNVCRQINEQFSLNNTGCTSTDGTIPDLNSALDESLIRDSFIEGETFPTGNAPDISNTACTVFNGQPSGCFNDTNTDEYVYYSVLLER